MSEHRTPSPDSPLTSRGPDRSLWQLFRRAPGGALVGVRRGRLVAAARLLAWSRRGARAAAVAAGRGAVEVPGLSAEVEVVRDEHGIPQLYADTTADLMRAQGYVQAQERFFEMDFRRHVTAGRLTELFGPTPWRPTCSSARWAGARRRAGAALLKPATRAALERTARASTPTSRTAAPTELAVRVHRPRPRRAGLPPASRGRRSTRWRGSRRWRGT